MPAKVRQWGFVGVLGAVILATVASSRAAQSARDDQPRRDMDRAVLALDGGGSRLGVMVSDVEAPAGQGAPAGVRIDEVTEGGAAARAGLLKGDVVVEFDGERVRSARQFARLVQETPAGRAVPLAVLRDGNRQSLTATPEAGSMAWTGRIDLDGERFRRDLERGIQEFRNHPPALDFHFDPMPGVAGVWPTRGRLGVTVDTMTDQLAAYFGAADGGALITSVREGSPAEKAGLKAGDVIVSIDGAAIRDAEALSSRMVGLAADELTIGYLRDRRAGTAKASLEPRGGSTERTGPRRRSRPAAFTRPA